MAFGIFDHAQQRGPIWARRNVEFGKAWLANSAQNFPRPVGAEVEAEETVAILGPCVVGDNRGGDKFIAGIFAV